MRIKIFRILLASFALVGLMFLTFQIGAAAADKKSAVRDEKRAAPPARPKASAASSIQDKDLSKTGSALLSIDPPQKWHWRHPAPPAHSLKAVAFGNGRFVAVGESGVIVSSTDAISWIFQESGTTERLLNVCSGEGKFVAVGAHGTILTSSGGGWAIQSSGTDEYLYDVAYGNGVFVAVGGGGIILTSPDGQQWTTTHKPDMSTPRTLTGGPDELFGVAFGNGQFMAAGTGFWTMRSSDGTNWKSTQTYNTCEASGVAYGNGVFAVAGKDYRDPHAPFGILHAYAADWSHQPAETGYVGNEIAFGNGVFALACDKGVVAVSSNIFDWRSTPTGVQAKLNGIVYAKGLFVAVGDYGSILTSSDTANWTNRSHGAYSSLSDVAFDHNLFVVVGDGGTILTSRHGGSWAQQVSGTTVDLRAVTFFKGNWIAVGQKGTILTSPDGKNWVKRSSGTNEALLGIGVGNGSVIAVGDAAVAKSLDGLTWQSRQTGTPSKILYDVACGPDFFVGVGSWDIYTSTDGLQWTSRVADKRYSCTAVTYAEGKFAAVDSKQLLTSTDGINWKPVADNQNSLIGLTHVGGLFVAVGPGGLVATSPDAVSWTQRQTGLPADLTDVTFGADTFVAVGHGGAIIQSDAQAPLAPSQLTATLQGGATVRLTWRDNSSREQGFRVFRKSPGEGYAHIFSVDANETVYLDRNLKPGTTYTYKVSAFNNDSSRDSAEASARTLTQAGGGAQFSSTAPSQLTARSLSTSSIQLSWQDNSPNEAGFIVWRKKEGGSYAEVKRVGAGATLWTDASLQPNTRYYYKVQGYRSSGGSETVTPFSNEAVARTGVARPDTPEVMKPRPKP